MSKSRHTTAVCCVIVALSLALTILFMNGEALGVGVIEGGPGYEERLFDDSYVHSIDIVIDEADWEALIANAASEEYYIADVVIDGEKTGSVGIRAKGNTSLSSVSSYGNDRYSLKIEFDKFDAGKSYYGLDKLALNNNIQDNTLMKDYLTYRMMACAGAAAPLASYAWVSVNGEGWGLYLALECVEDAFLERNYSGEGELYKPDSMSMAGGRGNGGDFNMEDLMGGEETPEMPSGKPEMPENMPEMPEGAPGGAGDFEPPEMGGRGEGRQSGGFGGGMTGADDVSLIYSNDEPASYSNIFDNAKTAVSSADEARLIAAIKAMNEGENIESAVDVESVIRYFVAHNFVVNFDSYTGSMIHNYYLYENEGLLSMIPWDYNLAFGGFVGGSDAKALANYPIDTPVSGGTIESRPMLAWIFESEEYTALYHQYFMEFIESFFDGGEFERLISGTAAMLAPYVERDVNGFCTYEEFQSGVSALREFCLLRAESVRGQLGGAIPSTSEGQAENGSALINASSVSISDMGGMGGNGGMGKRDFSK